MAHELAASLHNVRTLIKSLPHFTREQVEELINLELAGARRRSVGQRLAQRAARLDADATYSRIMKDFNNER